MIAARRPLPVLADIIIRRDFTVLMFCPQASNSAKSAKSAKYAKYANLLCGRVVGGQRVNPKEVQNRRQARNRRLRYIQPQIGAGARHTKSEAVDLPESEVFSRPKFKVLDVGSAYPRGWRQRFGVVSIPHVHPVDPDSQRMVFVTPEGAKAMTNVIQLASRLAVPTSLMDTTNPDVIRLHMQAENALSTALHYMRKTDFTPEMLQTATARAIRAATLLKRATQEQKGAA